MTLTQPSTADGQAALEFVLAHPRRVLLATDFDGTLAAIVDDPEQAYAHPDAAATLGRLERTLGGVAVITGRPVLEALRLGGFDRVEGPRRLRVLGQYGVESWDGATGHILSPPLPEEIGQVREALPELLADHDAADAYIEDKGRAVGVHTRRMANPAAALDRLLRPIRKLAHRHGLRVEAGRAVLEIRADGMDKGSALGSLIYDRPIDCVIYAGDDLGDLPAFDQVSVMRASGGRGLLICSANAEQSALVAQSDLVLDGPDAVVGWLAALATRLGT